MLGPCWAQVSRFHPAPGINLAKCSNTSAMAAMAVAPAAQGINLPATQGSSNSGGFIPGWIPVNGQFFEE